MSIFEKFKESVIGVRKTVEDYKDKHKMASEAISFGISLMPEPFNKFSSVIWNGLEKQEGGGDSSAKLLEILEKIGNNTEQSFSEINTNISELIQFGAKTEDIQKLGEQIRISNDSVTQILKEAFNEELDNATRRLEESFKYSLTELHLLESNLRLVTVKTEFGAGSNYCWKEGYFSEDDIKCGYDVRRTITDDIITNLEIRSNAGTILYGKPYYGKSTILKRIMFEMIDKGYAVVFSEDIRAANPYLVIQLLNNIAENYPKLLLIIDNVHRKGNETIFKVFNYFATRESSKAIKFLFSAREEEFNIVKDSLEREKAAETDTALRTIQQIRIGFSLEDAVLFLRKANTVSERSMREWEINTIAGIGYLLTGGDPFMFVLGLMAYVSGEDTATPMKYLHRDLNEKITSLKEDEKLFRGALLCSFMGMYGIPLVKDVLESNHIFRNHLKLLTKKGFLLFQNGEYKTRHERWALEFLIYIYCRDFDNDFASFDTQYNIKDMISSIQNNIDSNYLVNILTRSYVLYNDGRSKPIAQVVVDNYHVPDHLNPSKKAEVYNFGLGTFYYSIKEYERAIEYYDKALANDSNSVSSLTGKGAALEGLSMYYEAIECYDKAIKMDSMNEYALYNKGNALYSLKKYNEAIECYDKALAINPKDPFILSNKGNALSELRIFEEAIKCYDKALAINPAYEHALRNKYYTLNKLGKYNEASQCYDKALAINPNHANALKREEIAIGNLWYKEDCGRLLQ